MIFLALITLLCSPSCFSQNSFYVSFQDSEKLSENEWLELNGSLPPIKQFTECHWEKLNFFNLKSHSIWNYCTIKNKTDPMDCVQLWYGREFLSAGRDIQVGIKIGNGHIGYVVMKPFPHRAWNFLCWSYESRTGENKLYLNGKIQGSVKFDYGREIKGSNEVHDSSFSIGQEPDAFRGKYDVRQAFRGSISELNMWNYVLSEANISSLAACKEHGKGNVIAWSVENFKLFDVLAEEVTDVKQFCIPEEKLFLFPEKMSRPSAVALCKAHGGYLFTPQNEKENQQFLEKVTPYKSECEDAISGNIAWLGAFTENSEVFITNNEGKVIKSNFTKWDGPLFEPDNGCIFLTPDGKWKPYSSCWVGRTCPICGFVGTPVFTLKGNPKKMKHNYYCFLYSGLCANSFLDWNYYLKEKDGKIFYEGFRDAKISKVGVIWKTSYQISNETFISMNTTENKMQYPVGVFKGLHYDPNG